MTKIVKRPLSILLAVLMVMSLFAAVPMTVNAAPPSGGGGGGTGPGGTGSVINPVHVSAGFETQPYAIEGLVVNGSEQSLISAGTTADGATAYYYMTTEDITGVQANSLFNSPSKPGSFSTSIPKGKDAGTYYVWYAIDGGSNYEDLLPYMETNNTHITNKLTVTIAAPAPGPKTVDLSTLDTDYEAQDGDVLTGELKGDYQITVADGATVTLKDATITCLSASTTYDGIALLGDATILLEGENTVKGGHKYNAGIFVPEEKTLTIDGTGSLNVSSGGSASAIGAKRSGSVTGIPGGNIVINGGTINANGGNGGAGIGGCTVTNCGTITINGGNVTAVGNDSAPGIGSGNRASYCAGITITGGTVTATGNGTAAGIGCGIRGSCGDITIADTVTKVTATKGNDAPNSIGLVSANFTCGTITIGGEVTGNIAESPYVYPTYTVKWKNGDTVIETDTDVESGAAPTFNGTTPEKASDTYYDYTFSGWSDGSNTYAADALPAVSGDVTYTAQFTETAKTFKVYVKKLTGGTYTIDNLTGGTTVAQLKEIIADQIDIPVTAQQMLVFAGKNIEDAKTLAEYNIQKESTIQLIIRGYTVTWLNYDNSELGTKTVQYGATPSYDGETPTKPEDANNTYTFAAWDDGTTTYILGVDDLPPVTGDVTYTAVFTAETKTYTVTWKNGDTVLETDENVAADATPTYDGETPTKDGVTFAGWTDSHGVFYAKDATLPEVTADETYTAVFELTIGSVDEWNSFAASVKGGNTYSGIIVRMTADVGPVTTMVDGTFSGTFDGDGHTLTVNISGGSTSAATFAYVKDATIQNLRLEGTVTSSGIHTAALVKSVSDTGSTCTIKNVDIYADVNCSNGYIGGFIGHAGTANTVNIENSIFAGSINKTGATQGFIGAFIGWSQTLTATINNCAFTGSYNNIKSFNNIGFSYNAPTKVTVSGFYSNASEVFVANVNHGTRLYVPSSSYPTTVALVKNNDGETFYSAFSDALAAWTDGGTLTLLADVTCDSLITVPAADTKTLDLNGNALSLSYSSTKVEVNGTLTIQSTASGGSITPTTKSRVINVVDGGTLNIESGTINGYNADRAVIGGVGTINLNGGKIVTPASNAFSPDGVATLNLNGGEIECTSGSTSMGTASAVWAHGDSTINWNGTAITTNTGDGIRMKSAGNGTVNVTGGSFTATSSSLPEEGGYAIYCNSNMGTLNLEGNPSISGRGIYLTNDKVINITNDLSNTNPISVTMQTPGVFTSGLSGNGDASNFANGNGTGYALTLNASGEAQIVSTYTITWKNYDDTEIGTSTVNAGETPAFSDEIGEIKAKPEDDDYTYTFSGWSPEVSAVTGDTEYTAQFTAVPKPKKLTLNVGENGKVVMDNGTFGNATDASNIAEVPAPVNVADGAKVFIVDGHSANLVEGGSINIATGCEVSFYPSADNTGVITAIPAEGYVFAGWYNGDTLYSSDAALSYQNISENITLTASFTAHDPHSFVNDPTFNWTQDDSTGDWTCDTLTLSCACGATEDYEVKGFFGASVVTCTADANGDFTYSVSTKVDGVTYSDTKTLDANGVVKSVTQLKAAAKKGGSWELGADLTGVTDIQCANGFVLDGKNHTVTRHANVSTQAVFRTTTNPAEVTLKNLTIDGIAGQSDSKPAVATKMSNPSAGNVINLDNVKITNYDFDADNNGVVLAWGQATVNLKNCSIDTDSTYDVWGGAASNTNVDGGKVGSIYLNKGTTSGNASVTNGATVGEIVAFEGAVITADSSSNITVPASCKVRDNNDGTYTIVAKDLQDLADEGFADEKEAGLGFVDTNSENIVIPAKASILGVQLRKQPQNGYYENGDGKNGLRFITAVDEEFLANTDIKDYGYLITIGNKSIFQTCKETDNNVITSGDSEDDGITYFTAAVYNIPASAYETDIKVQFVFKSAVDDSADSTDDLANIEAYAVYHPAHAQDAAYELNTNYKDVYDHFNS